MAIDRTAWQRDWAVAPGEILQEALEDRAMSQSELARRMGRPIRRSTRSSTVRQQSRPTLPSNSNSRSA